MLSSSPAEADTQPLLHKERATSLFSVSSDSYAGLSHDPESCNTTSAWYSMLHFLLRVAGGAERVQGEPEGWRSCVYSGVLRKQYTSVHI